MGAVPIDSTNLRSVELRLGRPFLCGENEIQASLISSASVGATPTPATFRVQSAECKVENQCGNALITHYSLCTFNSSLFLGGVPAAGL